MIDTLAVKSAPCGQNRFSIVWSWHKNNTKNPIGGSFYVTVDSSVTEDAGALAEMRAIYYLLEEAHVHGANRLGNGICIEQSFGAIRKSLLKKSLKTSGLGKTQKAQIANAAEFLATKYFGAVVTVNAKPKEMTFKSFVESDIELKQDYPRAKLPCTLIGADIAISRHALYRQVARIDQKITHPNLLDDLSDVPDARFEAGWVWLRRILASDKLQEMQVRKGSAHKTPQQYASARYLHFADSEVPAVVVIDEDASGWVAKTVLRADQAQFLDWPAYVVGQRLVPARIFERHRQNKDRS